MGRAALLLVLGLLAPVEALAQTTFTTRAIKEFSNALTNAGRFGAPRYVTASLPACNTSNRGAVAFDTTTLTLKVCNASAWVEAGVAVGGTNVWTGSNTFTDSLFFIVDNGDATKKIQFEASGITTGTTRTFTVPNVAGTQTLLVTGVAAAGQTVAGSLLLPLLSGGDGVYFGGYSSASDGVYGNSGNTPDTAQIGTGSTSNAYNVAPTASANADFNNGSCGTAVCANPQINWMPQATSTTQYNSQAYWGNASEALKTLTESAATSLVRINVAASAGTGGILDYGIFASDATDQQLRQSSIRYSVTNKAGTETCTITTMAGAAVTNETNDGNAASISAGTLTYGITCDTTPANAVDIQFNAVSSLTQTTLQARYQVRQVGPGQVSPQ